MWEDPNSSIYNNGWTNANSSWNPEAFNSWQPYQVPMYDPYHHNIDSLMWPSYQDQVPVLLVDPMKPSLEAIVQAVAKSAEESSRNMDKAVENIEQHIQQIINSLNQETEERETQCWVQESYHEVLTSEEEDWAEANEPLEAKVLMECPPTPTTTLGKSLEVTTLPQPHNVFHESILDEDEDTDVDEPYEKKLEVGTCEDYVLHYTTELEAYEDSDIEESLTDEEFYIKESKVQLHANEYQVPEAIIIAHKDQEYKDDMEDCLEEESNKSPIDGPLILSHARPPDHYLPHSSFTFVPSIQETLEFVDHVEMVIGEYPNSDKKILLAVLVGHKKRTRQWKKRTRQWKKRKKTRKLKSYLSIVTKEHKLLTRDHLASLKKVKHLMEPRPKPPDYS